MEDKVLHLNEMPSKTWYWLKVNGCDIKLAHTNGESNVKFDKETKNDIDISNFEKVPTSMGQDFSDYVSNGKLNSLNITSDGEYTVTYTVYDKVCSTDILAVKVDDGISAKVNMIYMTNDECTGSAGIQTKIILGKDSKLKISQISLVSKSFNVLNDIGVICDDRARFENVKIMLGSNRTYSALRVELKGDNSNCRNDLVYYGKSDKVYDFNYVVNHYGKNTESEIYVNGVLDDSSKKTFRGTIDFKTGSAGSIGNEKEDVLMLGENVVNKTVPIILCTEEDVKGNHGASIGKLDDENLFYLESRGLDENEIKKLISLSKVTSKAKLIDNEKIVNMITTFIMEEMNG